MDKKGPSRVVWTARTLCPENPHGHSWKMTGRSGDEVTQRCRFCGEARTMKVYIPKTHRT